MAECIHGLEVPLCDPCYPKAVVDKPRPVRAAAPRIPRVAAMSSSRKSINVGEQRIYHVTHIRNLASIIKTGALLPAVPASDVVPVIDVSSELTRELRLTAEVSPGESVAGYVPFYLAPNAFLWEELRRGAAEPRWSAAAKAASSADFVILVSTVGDVGFGAVVTDGDAAGSVTRFATTADAVDAMVRRLHDDESARLNAEALVKGSFPFDAVQLIGVANDRIRDRVKGMVDGPKVAVYPPWFQPPE